MTPQNEPKPADDDNDESGGEDFRAHRRMHARDRREQNTGKSGKPYAERRDCGHIGRKRNAERTDDVGVLHARSHHAAEGRSINDEPGGRNGRDRYPENEKAIARIDEVADEHLTAQFRRDRKRKRRGAEHDAQSLLDDHRQPEGQQQT